MKNTSLENSVVAFASNVASGDSALVSKANENSSSITNLSSNVSTNYVAKSDVHNFSDLQSLGTDVTSIKSNATAIAKNAGSLVQMSNSLSQNGVNLTGYATNDKERQDITAASANASQSATSAYNHASGDLNNFKNSANGTLNKLNTSVAANSNSAKANKAAIDAHTTAITTVNTAVQSQSTEDSDIAQILSQYATSVSSVMAKLNNGQPNVPNAPKA